MPQSLTDRPPDPGRLSRFEALASFRYPEYRLFWIAGVASNMGMWALMAGRLWLINIETDGSGLMLGLVTFAGLGPVLLFAVWGGVIADRVNRLRLVTFTRALFAALAVLTGVLDSLDVIEAWHIIAISLATGVLLSFDIPSRQAMVSNLVRPEHVFNAIALYSLIFGAASIVGPILFVPIVKFWGTAGLFYLIGGSYIVTVVVMMMMRAENHQVTAKSSKLIQEMIEGFAYVRRRQVIITLLWVATTAGIFGMSFRTLLPIFADQIFEGGVNSYGILLLSTGVGGLLGTGLLAFAANAKNGIWFLLSAGTGLGAGLAAFSQITWFPASVVAIGFVGAFGAMFMAVNTSLVQSEADDQYRGRVMSILQLSWGTIALGGLLMGFLAEEVDAQFALSLGGILTAAVTVVLAFPMLRLTAARA